MKQFVPVEQFFVPMVRLDPAEQILIFVSMEHFFFHLFQWDNFAPVMGSWAGGARRTEGIAAHQKFNVARDGSHSGNALPAATPPQTSSTHDLPGLCSPAEASRQESPQIRPHSSTRGARAIELFLARLDLPLAASFVPAVNLWLISYDLSDLRILVLRHAFCSSRERWGVVLGLHRSSCYVSLPR
jgi:hypothetical protein